MSLCLYPSFLSSCERAFDLHPDVHEHEQRQLDGSCIKWFVIGAMMSDRADPFVVLVLTYDRLWFVNL